MPKVGARTGTLASDAAPDSLSFSQSGSSCSVWFGIMLESLSVSLTHTHACTYTYLQRGSPRSTPVPHFFPIAIYPYESLHLCVTVNMGVRMNSHCFNFLGLKIEVKVLVALSCLTLCDSMDCSLCPWGSPGKDTGVGSHFLLQGILENVKGSLLFFFFFYCHV